MLESAVVTGWVNPILTLAQHSSGGEAAAAAGGIFVLLSLLLSCGAVVFTLAMLAFWIWMIIDAATRQFPGENDKLIWVLIVVLTSWIGALIYFFVGRPKGVKG